MAKYTSRREPRSDKTARPEPPAFIDDQKSDIAPLFVPRDNAGYLIITCPKCLRPNRLEAMNLNGGLHETPCQACGTPVRFEINHEIEPLMKRHHA